MPLPKVVLIDYDEDLFAPQGWEGDFLAQAGAQWRAVQCREPEAILKVAHDAEVVMVQSVRPLLRKAQIQRLERCRCIVRVGIGYENVDVSAATECGIIVCNVPDYCVEEVADHALALLLASVRHVARQDRWIRAGRWDRTGARPARRLRGSVLGLIGFGRTARALAEKARGIGLTIIAFDPYISQPVADKYGLTLVELDDLLSRADLVSVHVPLTEETHHLLGEREFRLMKAGAVLVNTSRGPIVDGKALADALQNGPLAAAGLDVLEQEPPDPDSPLLGLDNVTLTPHVAAYAEESVGDLYRGACRIAIEVLAGRWPPAVVNPEVRDRLPPAR